MQVRIDDAVRLSQPPLPRRGNSTALELNGYEYTVPTKNKKRKKKEIFELLGSGDPSPSKLP